MKYCYLFRERVFSASTTVVVLKSSPLDPTVKFLDYSGPLSRLVRYAGREKRNGLRRRRIHWSPVNSPHKWPVTRKMFPFDDVIMDYLHCPESDTNGLQCNHCRRNWHWSWLRLKSRWLGWPANHATVAWIKGLITTKVKTEANVVGGIRSILVFSVS